MIEREKKKGKELEGVGGNIKTKSFFKNYIRILASPGAQPPQGKQWGWEQVGGGD